MNTQLRRSSNIAESSEGCYVTQIRTEFYKEYDILDFNRYRLDMSNLSVALI